jgi:hypothetical protein
MILEIHYLNKEKNYTVSIKTFNCYTKALKWGGKNIENFNTDMIKIKF